MKHYQNTLYVTIPDAYLAKEGETVAVKVQHETKLSVPLHTIGGIVCFGPVSCSPWLMQACAERDVFISFLSANGRFLARVQGPTKGNVLLRREQFRRADDLAASARMAYATVAAKIANCRTGLLRATRDRPDQDGTEALKRAAETLGNLVDKLTPEMPLDQIRGFEGDAGRVYFEVFDHLIVAQKEDFFFHGRNRRPPLDNMNALLSFLYTLLVHDVSGALQAAGLDPAVGYLHRDRPGRPGLALDMMEEFRPLLADRVALSLVNLRQVQGSGFRQTEAGGVEMDEATRKVVLVTWQKRKQEELIHPFLGERSPLALFPHIQALLLGRYLRGELDLYPAFIWK